MDRLSSNIESLVCEIDQMSEWDFFGFHVSWFSEKNRFDCDVHAIGLINRKLAELFSQLSPNGDCYLGNKLRIIFWAHFGAHASSLEPFFQQGLTLKVKPEGLHWASYSQLSGGQQAQTSLALSLAVNSVFPCPLCILDESVSSFVDASNDKQDSALDELAVDRLGKVLKNGSQQYLIVSHRPEVHVLPKQFIWLMKSSTTTSPTLLVHIMLDLVLTFPNTTLILDSEWGKQNSKETNKEK